MMKKVLLASVCGISLLTLSGCVPMALVGGGSAVMTSATEERGVTGVVSDADIKTRISWKFSQHDGEIFANINIVVRQGRVLLTGRVSTAQKHIAAVRYAWEVRGVKEVMDQIKTGKEQELGDTAKDSWVTTQLNSQLLFTRDINSVNYNIHTVDGVVYVMGIAQDKTELNRVLHVIRNTKDVKKVVNYAVIRTQMPKILKDEDMPDAKTLEPREPDLPVQNQEPFDPVDTLEPVEDTTHEGHASIESESLDTPSAFD